MGIRNYDGQTGNDMAICLLQKIYETAKSIENKLQRIKEDFRKTDEISDWILGELEAFREERRARRLRFRQERTEPKEYQKELKELDRNISDMTFRQSFLWDKFFDKYHNGVTYSMKPLLVNYIRERLDAKE
jgi:uncharacterized membrane protein YheB (UPF0754 family)